MNVLFEIIKYLEGNIDQDDEYPLGVYISKDRAESWAERLRRWCEMWDVKETQ